MNIQPSSLRRAVELSQRQVIDLEAELEIWRANRAAWQQQRAQSGLTPDISIVNGIRQADVEIERIESELAQFARSQQRFEAALDGDETLDTSTTFDAFVSAWGKIDRRLTDGLSRVAENTAGLSRLEEIQNEQDGRLRYIERILAPQGDQWLYLFGLVLCILIGASAYFVQELRDTLRAAPLFILLVYGPDVALGIACVRLYLMRARQ